MCLKTIYISVYICFFVVFVFVSWLISLCLDSIVIMYNIYIYMW